MKAKTSILGVLNYLVELFGHDVMDVAYSKLISWKYTHPPPPPPNTTPSKKKEKRKKKSSHTHTHDMSSNFIHAWHVYQS